MASSMPPHEPHHHQQQQQQSRPMDPRKRWNNTHGDNETEEGELRSGGYPQQQQQSSQSQQQQQQQQQQQSHHGHPKFRHRFQPPPPQDAATTTTGAAQPMPPPSSLLPPPPPDIQQRFQPPPSYPPPPFQQQQQQQHEHSYQQQQPPPPPQANDDSEYYIPLNKGNNHNDGGYPTHPVATDRPPSSSSLQSSHGSSGSLKNRWSTSAAQQQQHQHQREDQTSSSSYNYGMNDYETKMPPPTPPQSLSAAAPPNGAPPNFGNPPPPTHHHHFPPPPNFSHPPPPMVSSSYNNHHHHREPPQAPSSSSSHHHNDGRYPEQHPSSSSSNIMLLSALPQDHHHRVPTPPIPDQHSSQHEVDVVVSSSINNNNTFSPAQEEHQSSNNHQQQQQQQQQQEQPITEAVYTTSLHWKNNSPSKNTNNNTTATTIQKRPIDLPNDVEHITEVEWADDSSPSATHYTSNFNNNTNHTSTNTTNNEHHAPMPSMVTNLEKAPKPKPLRPEPCFCEPNLSHPNPPLCCTDTTCALFACQEECTTSCAAGPLCGNKRIQRKEWKKLSVFDAGLKGRGLMVQQHCASGDFIVEYVGVAVKKQYLDGLFQRYKHERMLYIMALDGDVYIDARHRGGIARYINHSCEPNCAVHRWKVRGISRAGVFALREIGEGEELSFDYQWDRKRGRALTKCHCGSEKCRGTIESEKKDDGYRSVKEEEEELLDEGHWLEMQNNGGISRAAGKEIMNRVIKVYFEENDEYYVADVAQYEEKTGRHLLMYHGDPEEHWTDLSKEKWMLLDEVGQRYAIARKNLTRGGSGGGAGKNEPSLLIHQPPDSALSSVVTSPRSDYSRSSSPACLPIVPGEGGGKLKNYMYVQTPVKDVMVARHTLFKCAQYCRVHIDTVNITVPRNGDNAAAAVKEEEEDDADGLKESYEKSEDGIVWKLVVTGMEVKKAIDWLEKIVIRINNELNGIENPPTSTLTSKGSSNALNAAAAAEGGIIPPDKITTELIIPRIIVDEVKRKYFSLKGYCYNVDVSFSHSDSKSKQFAKMTLQAEPGGNDMERALEYLNTELTQMCLIAGAPMTNIGVYKDLGFLGGELSSQDFRLLFESKRTLARGASNDCSEDLAGSTFAQSFMDANRCSIWVQAEEDMGRVSHNRIINVSYSNKPRKIFFGVAPARVPTLWGYLETRIADLHRGVQFLHLGPDRIYRRALMDPIRKNGRGQGGSNYFFDFVQKTSGASVRIDSITGSSHLRVDGGDIGVGGEEGSRRVTENVDLAIELVTLQIELLRDHHIRKQRWGFGRDWALLLESDHVKNSNPTTSPKNNGEGGGSSTQDLTALATAKAPASTADSLRLSDPRAVGTACLEISEIVTGAGLSEKVAAHACIIFYRYINLDVPSSSASPNNNDTNANIISPSLLNTSTVKLRDIQLASLFIANKSQKVVKWKRLEAVLEHAYRVFYPGSFFNPASEEAKNWERRVIKAEKAVLSALNYDVFWAGTDWVINAVVGTKAMAEPLAENAMALALSGHVLAAGPVLWLKYGPKYAFAAIAGFLSIDIEPLFPALSLQPLTVSHAAELIYHSCQALSRVKKSVVLQSKHELFSDSKVSLMGTNIQQVQKDCATYISKHQGQSIDDSKFVSSPAYKEISERAKLRRVFRGVRSDRIEEKVLPVLGKICFESKCTIRFSDGMLEGTNDIVLEGSWKALSIAEQLLCEVASLTPPVPYEQSAATNAMLYSALAGVNAQRDLKPPSDGNTIKQVKIQPGLLEMKKIDGKHGWYGTFDSAEKYDAGWKTCVAANAPQEHLDSAGLRWWVPHQYGPSLSGSLCEIFSSPKLTNHGSVDMRALALLAQSFAGGHSRLQISYPALASYLTGPEGDEAQENDRSVAISLQRWPPEKIELKERSTSGQNMQMGYSVAALQEMQLLHQLHFLIPSPQGHPNFILPLAIALDSDSDYDEKDCALGASSISPNKAANDILAMIERNQRAAGKRQLASGSHLVLEPTPLNLQKVISRYQRKNNGGTIIPPAVLASWSHDILSAISFCHSNHIVLRSLLPDQIHLDHSGTAKLSGLSKVMVLHGKDRTKEFDPLKFVRSKKGKDHNTEDVEPFAAPELLLGGTRHTKETDMWAFGSLLANLLLGKQLFPGKDRVSKMTQVFKIVGVPDKDNYERAKKFPFYSNNMYVIGDEGKKKKYSRGVEKAIRYMLRAFGNNNVENDFSGLISLIDGLLHLDPKKRMTADEALRHPYMMSHSVQVERQEFRQNYVKDWLDLKENVLTKGKSSKSRMRDSFAGRKSPIEQICEAPPAANGSSAEKELKRKAFLIGASSGVDGDDLYNLDDLLGSSSPSSKKPKFSDM